MPKKILLIENDAGFAGRLSSSLEATGFEVRVTGEGKDGLDLARDWSPEAVVLCVELPGMSGYLVCQKLKKDDALKHIPLVLTSAEATAETFEKHRTLKARADDYLLKPYEPAALVEKLGALVGLPEAAPEPAGEGPALALEPDAEEELVSLEEEVGIGAADGEPGAEVPGLDLESLPDEPSAASGEPRGGVDDDLRLLDDAFDSLSTPAAEEAAAALDELAGERPVAVDDVDAAAATLPDEDEGARPDLSALDADADAALGALAGVDETLSPGLSLSRQAPPPLERGDEPGLAGGDEPPPTAAEAFAALDLPPEPEPEPVEAKVPDAAFPLDAEPARPPVRGASADLLRKAGIKLLDEALSAAPAAAAAVAAAVAAPAALGTPAAAFAAPGADPAALARLEAELRDARAEADRLRADLAARDGSLRDLERKIAAVSRRADEATEEIATARARADAADEKVRAAEADAAARRDEARRAAEQARAAEAGLAEAKRKAADADRRTGEFERRAVDQERRAAAAEDEAKRATEEGRRAADEAKRAAEELKRKAEELARKAEEAAAAAEALARAEALEREADGLRTELLVARGEADGARGEVEKRTAEMKRRLSELEAANSKNEERVVRAYQKIKADEKVRDKVRKALAIATQLLEEGLPAESAADKERRAAAAAATQPRE